MASDDVGVAIGAILLSGLIIAASVIAVIIGLGVGSLVGGGVGFINYCKSFRANVRRERPGV